MGVGGVTLDDWAFLFTATEKGNNSGIRFLMTTDHAQVWCSSPVSSGMLHGTRWAYFWTSVKNYTACHWGTQRAAIDARNLTDNGEWDERIAAAGCVKVEFEDWPGILVPLGVDVILDEAGHARMRAAEKVVAKPLFQPPAQLGLFEDAA